LQTSAAGRGFGLTEVIVAFVAIWDHIQDFGDVAADAGKPWSP